MWRCSVSRRCKGCSALPACVCASTKSEASPQWQDPRESRALAALRVSHASSRGCTHGGACRAVSALRFYSGWICGGRQWPFSAGIMRQQLFMPQPKYAIGYLRLFNLGTSKKVPPPSAIRHHKLRYGSARRRTTGLGGRKTWKSRDGSLPALQQRGWKRIEGCTQWPIRGPRKVWPRLRRRRHFARGRTV